ncbi:MAG: glycosyltransferase [Thermoflexales bacterium]|nr:glycosyltransferase [Thermoflexales bacterium]
MRLLFVTPYVPSRIRTRPYHLLRELARQGHPVTLLTAATSEPEVRDAEELRGWGIRVDVFRVPRARSLGNCLLALPTREPLQAVYAYHPAMERRLAELARSGEFDRVHIEHLRAARLVRAVPGIPTVYDSVDCISLLFEQTMAQTPRWTSRLLAALDLGRTRRYEARLLARYNRVVVSSRRDKEALEALARRYLPPLARPAPITVVTNGVDLEYFRPQNGPRDSRTVVFTGKMSYHANVAGALYFAHQVLPLIWARDPEVRFWVVGKDPPEVVQRLARDPRILVTGTVDDLRPYLAQATVAVCPIPYAVGIQNKVLEAMAMGTPVVCTRAAAEGLEARPGEDLLVADTAEAFAHHVLRVLEDPALAERLGAAGRRYVETCHDWRSIAGRLVEVYRNAGDRGADGLS